MTDTNITDNKERIIEFDAGEFLFRQNDLSKDLYILKKGSVRIFKNEGGVEIELDIIGSGNVVGEIASIDGGPRTASGMALEKCETLLVPYDEFSQILSSIPDWFKKISLILVQRLREVDSRISRSIEGERTNHIAAIISLLAFTKSCTSTSEGYVLDRKSVEYQVIDLLNIPLSEIDICLERLKKQNYLRLDRNRIILSCRESLDELAEKVFQSTTEIPAT